MRFKIKELGERPSEQDSDISNRRNHFLISPSANFQPLGDQLEYSLHEQIQTFLTLCCNKRDMALFPSSDTYQTNYMAWWKQWICSEGWASLFRKKFSYSMWPYSRPSPPEKPRDQHVCYTRCARSCLRCTICPNQWTPRRWYPAQMTRYVTCFPEYKSRWTVGRLEWNKENKGVITDKVRMWKVIYFPLFHVSILDLVLVLFDQVQAQLFKQ